jgi:hypothetical protein
MVITLIARKTLISKINNPPKMFAWHPSTIQPDQSSHSSRNILVVETGILFLDVRAVQAKLKWWPLHLAGSRIYFKSMLPRITMTISDNALLIDY